MDKAEKIALRTKRAGLKVDMITATGYMSRCGYCGLGFVMSSPDLHHVAITEGQAVTLEQKMYALDPRNVRLVHGHEHVPPAPNLDYHCFLTLLDQYGPDAIENYVRAARAWTVPLALSKTYYQAKEDWLRKHE